MDQQPATINSFRKYLRVTQHIEFLNACILHKIIPKFCQFSDKTKITTQLSTKETENLEKRKLQNEFEAQMRRADSFKNINENNSEKMSLSSNSPTDFINSVHFIENYVKKSEHKF